MLFAGGRGERRRRPDRSDQGVAAASRFFYNSGAVIYTRGKDRETMGVPNDVTILEVLGVFLTPLAIMCAAFAQCYFIRAGLIQMREASVERNRHLDNLEEMIRQQGEAFREDSKRQEEALRQQGEESREALRQQGEAFRQQGEALRQQGEALRQQGEESREALRQQGEAFRQQGEMLADIGAGIREASAGIREASAGIRHLIEKQNQAPPP